MIFWKWFTTLLLSVACLPATLLAQELSCKVSINRSRVQGVDPRIFSEMERDFTEFFNLRRFTETTVKPEERIACNFIMTIEEMPSLNNFKATVQIQSARPVYGTNYNTVVLNYIDKDFDFEYVESMPLDFNPNTFTNNLTSLLGFYAYVIIGCDYDTYEKLGGRPYFLQAQVVLNNAQSSNKPGWQSFEGVLNRYWLLENLLNQQFNGFREAVYNYYRLGLDVFVEKPEDTRKHTFALLKQIEEVRKQKPLAILITSFFQAKNDEIVNIFMKAEGSDRIKAADLLKQLNPTKQAEYERLTK